MPILEVKNLGKSYGQTLAVDDFSFSVNAGEIVGLLGPNGAGKTTTINMLLSVLEPTHGSISIDGHNLKHDRSRALAKTNFAAVYAQVPGNLTVYENLKIFGLIYDIPNLEQQIQKMITEFDLVKFKDTRCGVLSSGEQTRVSVAKALLNEPKLLLLDEPTASLDPATAQTIRQQIMDHARHNHCAILWTSHNMREVATVCDRIMFLSHGKILMQGDPKTLPAEHNQPDLEALFIAVAKESLQD